MQRRNSIVALATNTSCQDDVLGHERDTVGVQRAQVGVLKHVSHVGLSCLLQGQQSLALEAELWVCILGDGLDKAHERQLGHDQVSLLLQSPNLSQGHSPGSSSHTPGFVLFRSRNQALLTLWDRALWR